MSGGGDGFGEDILDSVTPSVFKKGGNFFGNLINDDLNFGLQLVTGGLLGFKDGKLRAGATTELVKEMSGAKAAEDANEMARQQFEEQKLAAEQDRQNAIVMKGREQIQASMLAGAARRAGTNTRSFAGGALLGSDEKDFLGL